MLPYYYSEAEKCKGQLMMMLKADLIMRTCQMVVEVFAVSDLELAFLFLSVQHFSSFILYMILIPGLPESQLTFNGRHNRVLLTSMLFSAYLHAAFLSLFPDNPDSTYICKAFYLAMSISWMLVIYSDYYMIRQDCFELVGEKDEKKDTESVVYSLA